jgi:glycerophosphoryl diester phosphodiesterase
MMTTNGFLIIAHRGASGYRPENTMSAFQYAWELGIMHIECDLRYTKDHQIVIFHDATVDRTTDGSGRLDEFTFDELRQLDAGSWFGPEFAGIRVPSLDELLDRAPKDTHFTLELKDPDLSQFTDDVIASIHLHAVADRVHLSSFNFEQLAHIHAVAPELTTAALFDCKGKESNENGEPQNHETQSTGLVDSIDVIVKSLRPLGVNIACPPARAVSQSMVEALHGAGFIIRAWGLDKHGDADEMKALIEYGVDGMTTNFPDVLERIYHLHTGPPA